MPLGVCRRLSAASVLLLGACQLAAPPDAPDPTPAGLRLPPGYAIEVFAKVPGARSLLVADDGARVYVATRDSEVFAILDPDRDRQADQVVAVAGGLKVPNGLALAPDGTLLVVEQHRIISLDRSGRAKAIVPPGVLPDQSDHGWRYAGVGPDGKLYVSIGAPCNICRPKGFEGTIIRLRPDGTSSRSSPAACATRSASTGIPRPANCVHRQRPRQPRRRPAAGRAEPRAGAGLHFGFPYVHGDNVAYPAVRRAGAAAPVRPPALASGPRRRARDRLLHGRMFPAEYRTTPSSPSTAPGTAPSRIGYRIMRVTSRQAAAGQEVFIDGWLEADGSVRGRPVDLEELPDGSLLISDDLAGLIYRVTYDPAGPGRD